MAYLTGYITTCPYCQKDTNIPAERTTDKTTIQQLPEWEKGNCRHCGKLIYITVDVKVVATDPGDKVEK